MSIFRTYIDSKGNLTFGIHIPSRISLFDNRKVSVSWVRPWQKSYDSWPWLFASAPGLIRVAGVETVWVGDVSFRNLWRKETPQNISVPRTNGVEAVSELTVKNEQFGVLVHTDRGSVFFTRSKWDRILTGLYAKKDLKQFPSEGFTWITPELKVPNRLLAGLVDPTPSSPLSH